MNRPIVNLADVELKPFGDGGRCDGRIGAIASQLGA